MQFGSPAAFLLLIFLIPMVWVYLHPRKSTYVAVPSTRNIRALKNSPYMWMRHLPFALRIACLTMVIIALARPLDTQTNIRHSTVGLDIMLVVDTSHSMEGRDFELEGRNATRIEVAKAVMAKFIQDRPDDRIGIVIFGSQAFTQAPLTLDHNVLVRFLAQIRTKMVGPATAIGDAVATSVKRLKDLKGKSKIAILLTDGENSAGRIEPLPAASAAAALGVKVYTVGIGNDGPIPVLERGRMVRRVFPINETVLKEIAAKTGARYFRAKNTEALEGVYETIDKLEKTEVKVRSFTKSDEKFASFVWPALAFLIFEILLGISRFRRVP
jgi:Ca-activated chloride channel homolog